MAHEYKYLDAEDKADVEADVAERDKDTAPVVDDTLAAAWERDHYAHSLLLAKAIDDDERQAHTDAMTAIEDALKASDR